MKKQDHRTRKCSERGAAMLAALCLAMVFAISLSSYIGLCYVSLGVSTRNVLNAHCAELAEAGVEQALYSINNGVSSGWTISTVAGTTTMSTTMTMTSAGLVQTSTGPTPLNYGNNANGEAVISIKYPAGSPKSIQTIVSQGKMLLPNGSLAHGANVTTVTRTLTVTGGAATSTSSAEPLFVNAVAAIGGKVNFRSAGTVDSYYSGASPGPYNTYGTGAGAAGYSAVVLSSNVTSSAVSVKLNNTVVNGYAVGYDAGSPSSTNWLSYSTSGKLEGYSTPVGTFIDSSRILSSPVPYQPVFPENLPNGTGNLPIAACTPNTSNILTNTCSLGPNQVYYASGISLASGDTVTINGSGPTVIIVYGNISMTGTARILVSANASLAIFAENGTVSINCTGIGGIVPAGGFTPVAKNIALLSTNNNSIFNTVAFTQATAFYGVIYFPYLKVTVGSTGTGAPIFGSIVGESVTFSNSPVIHYDRALRTPDSASADVAFTYIAAPSTVSNLVASTP